MVPEGGLSRRVSLGCANGTAVALERVAAPRRHATIGTRATVICGRAANNRLAGRCLTTILPMPSSRDIAVTLPHSPTRVTKSASGARQRSSTSRRESLARARSAASPRWLERPGKLDRVSAAATVSTCTAVAPFECPSSTDPQIPRPALQPSLDAAASRVKDSTRGCAVAMLPTTCSTGSPRTASVKSPI